MIILLFTFGDFIIAWFSAACLPTVPLLAGLYRNWLLCPVVPLHHPAVPLFRGTSLACGNVPITDNAQFQGANIARIAVLLHTRACARPAKSSCTMSPLPTKLQCATNNNSSPSFFTLKSCFLTIIVPHSFRLGLAGIPKYPMIHNFFTDWLCHHYCDMCMWS